MGSAVTPVHGNTQANPMSSTAGSGATSADGSTISANDFLTLLVTEMKNQDPTAQTDPNEYINQLVQVNSLEQLIQINQNLSAAVGGPSPDIAGSQPGGAPTATGAPATGTTSMNPSPIGQIAGIPQQRAARTAAQGVPTVAGNLSIPKPVPAAERVAQALAGR